MKKYSLKGVAVKLIALASLFVFVVSCSKDNIIVVPGKSDYNNLPTFMFKKSDNPSLTEDCSPFFSSGIVFMTVPEGTNITSLKPSFTISPAATIKINNASVTGNPPAMDFSGIVRILVTSESGKSQEYRVLTQTGKSQLDRMVYAFMDKYSIPGISFAISKNEQII